MPKAEFDRLVEKMATIEIKYAVRRNEDVSSVLSDDGDWPSR
jgi:hypothetical protein